MSVVRFIKNKLTKKGNIVSKWVFQSDPKKDYSDFELMEKTINVLIDEGWYFKKGDRLLHPSDFIKAIWEERF